MNRNVPSNLELAKKYLLPKKGDHLTKYETMDEIHEEDFSHIPEDIRKKLDKSIKKIAKYKWLDKWIVLTENENFKDVHYDDCNYFFTKCSQKGAKREMLDTGYYQQKDKIIYAVHQSCYQLIGKPSWEKMSEYCKKIWKTDRAGFWKRDSQSAKSDPIRRYQGQFFYQSLAFLENDWLLEDPLKNEKNRQRILKFLPFKLNSPAKIGTKSMITSKSTSSSKSEKVRPSPTESATTFSIGTKRKGNDGNMWIIKVDKNGVKRWKKL